MDSLSVGRKEASKTQTAMNEDKKKPLEMLVIEWLNIKRGGWDCKEAVKRERKRLMALFDRKRVERKDCNGEQLKRRTRDRIQRNTGVHSWFTQSHAGTSSKAASHFCLLAYATVLLMSEAKLLSLPHHWKLI